jgi:hypothetical protein
VFNLADKQASFLTYKGRPLVRKGNQIYYGDINDPYVILLSVAESHEVHGVKIADKVKVQLINTKEANPLAAIEKTTDKNGMYAAIEIASIWLERALKA